MPEIYPYKEWEPEVNLHEYSCDFAIVTPSPVIVPFVIKNIEDFDTLPYADFRLKTEIQYDIPGVEWINTESYEGNGYYEASNPYVPYYPGLEFNFTPVFQNLELLSTGIFTFSHIFRIQGLYGGYWYDLEAYSFDIVLTVGELVVVPDPVVTFLPATLVYTHQQNETLPSHNIAMTGDLWKIIGKPNFILTSPTAGVTIATVGSGDSAYKTASGSGNAIVSIALGAFYDGESDFSPTDLASTFEVQEDNLNLGYINWTVNVRRLSDFLTLPFAPGEKLFTLDQDYFEFNSNNVGTFFQFDTLIKTYDFFTNVLNEFTIPQKVVLFQGKAKVNLGQVIHRLMRKFNAVNETLLQYKLATVDLTVSEIDFATETVLRSGTVANIPFVAGLSRGLTTFGFLDFNPLANRATKNGFALLNILYPEGSYELRTFKNGTLVSSVALPESTDTIVCKKVSFSAFAKGDVVQYIVDVVGETNSSAPKKTFKLFPEGNYSNTIVWQNEFLLQSPLECTGTASIKTDFEFISQKVWENLVEILEHLSSSKEVKLYINTGWLLNTDVDTIESLMRSKRAWLLNSKGNISLRPIGKSMINQDLQRELIEYSLEFTINRNYDEETYSL